MLGREPTVVDLASFHTDFDDYEDDYEGIVFLSQRTLALYVCEDCSVVVVSPEQHKEWHKRGSSRHLQGW